MSGIDYRRLFAMITLGDVLHLIGYQRGEIIGVGTRGPCPLVCSPDARSCTLSWVDDFWKCHRCGRSGKPFKLYMMYRGLGAYSAAVELCRMLGKPVPWMPRGRPAGRAKYTGSRKRLDKTDGREVS
jgi:hypothetical protein